jgi:hypothetical protein
MKKSFIVLFLCIYASILAAQMKVVRSVTYVIDKYENKWRHWGGDVETIRFAAVKEVTETDSSITMQIQVTNKDWEKTGTSTGIVIGGNGGYAVGGSSIETVQKRTGLIILTKREAIPLFDFENDMYKKSASGQFTEKETTWSITIGDRFTASTTYSGKWTHIWTIDGASFEIPETEVIPMFRKLKIIAEMVD